jgi:hypothetical protein
VLVVWLAFEPLAIVSRQRLLQRFPTPLEWIAELRRRGVRVDESPIAVDVANFPQ